MFESDVTQNRDYLGTSVLVKDNIDINSVDFSNKVRRLLSDGSWPRSFNSM
jgi:hypothetical protein